MTHEQRVEVTQRIIAVLDDWGVTDSDQVKLLGLPDGTRSRIIRSYRKETPLPEDEKVFERVDHFAGIAHALWTSNPRNSQAGALWMNQVNKHFQYVYLFLFSLTLSFNFRLHVTIATFPF